MNFKQGLEGLHQVEIDVDYKNPLLAGNVEGVSKDTMGAYEYFLGRFRSILESDRDNIGNGIIQSGHHRAHLSNISSVICVGKDVFFYKGIKGSGLSNPEGYISKKDGNWTIPTHTNYSGANIPELVLKDTTKEYDWGYEIMGAFDDRIFSRLKKNGEYLGKIGARVEMIASSGILKEVIYNGEKTTTEQLKNNGIIPNDPELKLRQVERLTRSRFRIKDFKSMNNFDKIEALKETLSLLNKEKEMLGLETFYDIGNIEGCIGDYLQESVSNLSMNLGIILSKGYNMGYMNSGNITLGAGEIVDLDSLEDLSKNYKTHNVNFGVEVTHYKNTKLPKEVVKDIRYSIFAINILIKEISKLYSISRELRNKLTINFINSFKKHYNYSRRLNHYYKEDDLYKCIEEYSQDIIENNNFKNKINIS